MIQNTITKTGSKADWIEQITAIRDFDFAQKKKKKKMKTAAATIHFIDSVASAQERN